MLFSDGRDIVEVALRPWTAAVTGDLDGKERKSGPAHTGNRTQDLFFTKEVLCL